MTFGRAPGEPLSDAELEQRREARRQAAIERVERTRCVHGHPFTRANTYYHPTTGKRECRRCRRERQQAKRDLQREIAILRFWGLRKPVASKSSSSSRPSALSDTIASHKRAATLDSSASPSPLRPGVASLPRDSRQRSKEGK